MILALELTGVRLRSVSADAIRATPHFSWIAILTITEVVLALVFGGGTLQGLWSDALVQLASLPLLAIAANELLARGLPDRVRWPLGLICVALLLPILQLIPLPPFVWIHLPGRASVVVSVHAAGMALPWSPVSLDPAATQRSLLSLLPAIAVFLAALSLETQSRRLISLLIMVFAVVSVLLGLAQIAGGSDSPLRFYQPTNTGDSVGFFANRNHYAALLYCAIPLATTWNFTLLLDRRLTCGFGLVLILLAYSFILLGLGMAHSRAGVMLAFAAGLASVFLGSGLKRGATSQPGRKKVLLAVAFANLFGLSLAFQFGFVGIANRFGNNGQVLEDLRWPIAKVTLQATTTNLPFGVGFGAFEPVYQMFETRPAVVEPYVNHAHDDWLELILDGGVPAAVAAFAFMFWYVVASWRVWRPSFGSNHLLDDALARAGSIIVGALLVHSALDYPLRTTTLMVVFAFGCALMIPPVEPAKNERLMQQRPV